jgi:hypothetical protein
VDTLLHNFSADKLTFFSDCRHILSAALSWYVQYIYTRSTLNSIQYFFLLPSTIVCNANCSLCSCKFKKIMHNLMQTVVCAHHFPPLFCCRPLCFPFNQTALLCGRSVLRRPDDFWSGSGRFLVRILPSMGF